MAQLNAVDDTLGDLVAQVRRDTARRSRVMAQRLDARAMLSPRANEARAASVCRAATRKRVSVEELRIEAQRAVRLNGTSLLSRSPEKSREAPQRPTGGGGEGRGGARATAAAAAALVRTRLDALDVHLALELAALAAENEKSQRSAVAAAATATSARDAPREGGGAGGSSSARLPRGGKESAAFSGRTGTHRASFIHVETPETKRRGHRGSREVSAPAAATKLPELSQRNGVTPRRGSAVVGFR